MPDVSGVKRSRMTYEREQPSVHVSFNSLTRASKQKLKELLQHWSEWHAQHDPAELDSDEVLESGEETYFPALRVGIEKSSMVFWIENETRKQHDNVSSSLDGDAVPLYDRGFALGLTSAEDLGNGRGIVSQSYEMHPMGLEIVDDAARCFNCGSYSHSLKECPKPRDHVAVNNARRQHKSKRHQKPGSRSASRYYQNSSGGKYDGLKPGSLDGETRKLLGLAELDPPPWLNRMRELGYPPGYLDPVDEDQPSGITIFTDEDDQLEQEDGEIIGMGNPEPPKKKSVDFPGINAPIPENADERLWEVGSSGFDFRNQSHHKMNHYSEPMSWRHNTEHRRPRDFRDDGPPGVDLPFSPSSFPPRYGNHESSYTSESPRDVAPAFARSYSDRGRGTSAYEDFPSHSSSSYSSSNKRHSPQDLGSSGLASESDDWRDRYSFHYSYRGHDDHDRHRQRSWR
ncbi:hypothetical protein Tsubulata_005087 [Turnera subulata]|uniref:CCHC-type domain-containing protein n=1 Tax=Turnera subulata TaxID=218843 RepID=A0A9Q0FKL7_9ROSI|nr:hypothetical protein Tsubulata_005087 [Turnera subulata]